MNVLSDFIIRLENGNPSFADEVNELKESASKIVEKGKKYIKVKADSTSRKIEKTIQKGPPNLKTSKKCRTIKLKS